MENFEILLLLLLIIAMIIEAHFLIEEQKCINKITEEIINEFQTELDYYELKIKKLEKGE